jgi:hypothetical protein
MAKIKVHAANFPYLEINATGSCIFIKTGAFQLTGETIHGSRLVTIESASEDSVKKVGGAIGWGSSEAFSLLGRVVSRGIAWRKQKEVTFVAEVDDGRKFMGTTDHKTFIGLQGAAMKF